MQVRILGAHQSNSASTRATSLLVDGVLAIDAGSVASALTLEEQDAIKAVLLTHQHYDHLKDIPSLGLNTLRSDTINVFCIKETREAIFAHLLNDVLWPNLTKMPSAEHPTMAFFTVAALHSFTVDGYAVLPVSVNHTVPAVGYQVEREGRRMFYTSDMGSGGDKVWPHVEPHVLIAEVTFPNRLDGTARDSQHLTASLLHGELADFRSSKGYLPRIVVIHVSAHFDAEVRQEVHEVAEELGADIVVANEDLLIEV